MEEYQFYEEISRRKYVVHSTTISYIHHNTMEEEGHFSFLDHTYNSLANRFHSMFHTSYLYHLIAHFRHSVVYKGRKRYSIQYVAIKKVDKSEQKEVWQEVQFLCQLTHPNCLQFHTWYETRNHIWLILEFCTGRSLYSLLKADKYIPEPALRVFAVDLVNALHYLHSSGILYCDLKPSNILLNENGVLKLADFALAQNVLERTPLQKGSPVYMSPELFRKPGKPTTASDLWALGCVLYELAFGYPPFASASASASETQSLHQLAYSITHKPVRFNLKADATHGNDLVDLLGGLLEKRVEERMAWPELVQHVFWDVDVPAEGQRLVLPSLESTATIVTSQRLMEESDAVVDANDLARLSRNAKHNRRRESLENGSSPAGSFRVSKCGIVIVDSIDIGEEELYPDGDTNGDVRIEHADTQLDFQESIGRSSVETEDDSDLAAESPCAQEALNSRNARSFPQQRKGRSSSIAISFDEPYRDEDEDDQEPLLVSELSLAEVEVVSSIDVRKSCLKTTVWTDVWKPNNREKMNLSLLLQSAQDRVIKPIVQTPEPSSVRYRQRGFSFKVLPVETVVKMEAAELRQFLLTIYADLDFKAEQLSASSASACFNKATHVLGYLYGLCVVEKLANTLVNSSLTAKLVSMAKLTHSHPTSPGTERAGLKLRGRIALVLAVLIRHATFLRAELAKAGLIACLVSLATEENANIRGRGAAGLGEVLFYISTNSSQSSWAIPAAAMTKLLRCLREGEQETVRLCALRTYENVLCCARPQWVQRFATREVAMMLLSCIDKRFSDEMHGRAAMAIFHLVRANRRMLPKLAEHKGRTFLIDGVTSGSPKVKQALLNILNLVMISPASECFEEDVEPQRTGDTVIDTKLTEEKEKETKAEPWERAAERRVREELMASTPGHINSNWSKLEAALLHLIQSESSSLLKGKALICLALNLRLYPWKLLPILEKKFLMQLDRLCSQIVQWRTEERASPCDALVRDALQLLGSTVDLALSDLGRAARDSMNKAEATLTRLRPHVIAGRDINALPQHSTALKEVSERQLPIIIHLVTNRFVRQFIPQDKLLSFTAFAVRFDTTVEEMSERSKREYSGEVSRAEQQSNAAKEEQSSPMERTSEGLRKMVVVLAESVAGSSAVMDVEAGFSMDLLTAFVQSFSRPTLDMRLRYLRIAVQTTHSLLSADPSVALRNAENDIIAKVLPKLRSLLRDHQPIPQVCMKLVSLMLKQRPKECAARLHAEGMVLPILQNVPIQHDIQQGDLPKDVQVKPCRHLLGILARLLEEDQDPIYAQELVMDLHLTERLTVIARMLLEAHAKDPRVRLQEWLDPFFIVLHSLIRLTSSEEDHSEIVLLEKQSIFALLQHPALTKLLHALCSTSTDRCLNTKASVLQEAIALWTTDSDQF